MSKSSAAGQGCIGADLDADLYVPALLRGIYGNKLWMAKIRAARWGGDKSGEEEGCAREWKAGGTAEAAAVGGMIFRGAGRSAHSVPR